VTIRVKKSQETRYNFVPSGNGFLRKSFLWQGPAAPKWEFEQINFVVSNHRSAVESDFYTKLKNLIYKNEMKKTLC